MSPFGQNGSLNWNGARKTAAYTHKRNGDTVARDAFARKNKPDFRKRLLTLTLSVIAFASAAPAQQSQTLPGQGEILTSPRSVSANPLLIPFVADTFGFETEITIANTSADTFGSAAQGGSCTISVYGAGAPPGLIAVPGGTLAAGASTSFLLSAVAPGFQGYAIVNCTFPLARVSARVEFAAVRTAQVVSVTPSEAVQALTLPRNIPARQALLFPFVSNQDGFDTGIAIANTSLDPFGASGAAPTSGTCTLSFYGTNAPVPNTGILLPTGVLTPGTSSAFLISNVAPGFQGYMIAQCNFGAAAGFVFLASNFGAASQYAVSVTPEAIVLPRSSSPQPLLFSAVTNQPGADTGIVIANTSADPFGTTQAGGVCTLNFYGSGAPPSPAVTPNIPPGQYYAATVSEIAPGFTGYITATCPFGPARGFALVSGRSGGPNVYDYSLAPEVVQTPRSAAATTLLFSDTRAEQGFDTSITIVNTSADTFGTAATSGACTIHYFGQGSPVATQSTPSIGPGNSWSFLLSQAAPGFSGYIIASCSFPLARGTAEILTAPIPFSGSSSRQSTSLNLTCVSTSGSVPFTLAYTSAGNFLSGQSSGIATPSGTSIALATNSGALPPSGTPYTGTITVSDARVACQPSISVLPSIPQARPRDETKLRVRDGTGGGTLAPIPVTLALNGRSLVATPNVVNISVPAGEKSVLQMQASTVTPAGFTATLVPLDSFLLLSPASGMLTLPEAFSVGVDATSLAPGSYLSSIAVQCATCFDTAVAINTTVTAPAGTAPAITPNGIVPAFSTSTTVQSGEWISIYGNNLGTGTFNWKGDFPTSLGGTTVMIDGKYGYLSYVGSTQINVQVPDDSTTGIVPVVVTTPNGSATSSVTLGEFGPSFCLLGDPHNHVAGIIYRFDGSGAYGIGGNSYDIIGPTGTSLGYKTVAARAGDIIAIFGVGFGPTTPSVLAGQAFSGAARTNDSVTLLINNVGVPLQFSGLSEAGLYQFNLMVPSGLGTGDMPLMSMVGGASSQPNVVIALQ